MRIQFKLEASSNNDPNTSRLDKGCNRRGRMNSFKSQFVDSDELVDEANHVYKKDKSLEEKFRRSEYRLGLFHLLAPYAKKYYDDGIQIPSIPELVKFFDKDINCDNKTNTRINTVDRKGFSISFRIYLYRSFIE